MEFNLGWGACGGGGRGRVSIVCLGGKTRSLPVRARWSRSEEPRSAQVTRDVRGDGDRQYAAMTIAVAHPSETHAVEVIVVHESIVPSRFESMSASAGETEPSADTVC